MIETDFKFPPPAAAVIENFWTCEFTTISKYGNPITWPVYPMYLSRSYQFLIMSPIGLPQKSFNVRRNPKVSLFYSNPVGSGLDNPAAVLIRGLAESPDEVFTPGSDGAPGMLDEVLKQVKRLMKHQPAVATYLGNPVSRWLMDWYFLRLAVFVRPVEVQWWPGGDLSRPAEKMAVEHVG